MSVGLDPVVRARIWTHLQSLTQSGKKTRAEYFDFAIMSSQLS